MKESRKKSRREIWNEWKYFCIAIFMILLTGVIALGAREIKHQWQLEIQREEYSSGNWI